jgi:K+/H+ antiporter YhaU regulatory subunit KhtT
MAKLSEKDFNEVIDEIDERFRNILIEVPAILMCRLEFMDSISFHRALAEYPIRHPMSTDKTILAIKNNEIRIIVPMGGEAYIYKLADVKHK